MKQLIALILVFILAACSPQPRSVSFDGTSYQIQTSSVSSSGTVETYRTPDERILTVEREVEAATVTVEGEAYHVTGSGTEVEVTFPDGRTLTRQYSENSAAGLTGLGVEASTADWNRVDELREIVFHTTFDQQTGQRTWRYLLGVLIFALGLFQLINPRLAWQVAEGWRYQNLEPSETYLGLSRAAGVVLMLVAVFIAFGLGG